MMQLYIANKNYSSWSMRPWLVLKAFDLAFEEIQLNFPCERGEGDFKQRVLEINPNGKVPALLDQGMLIWDFSPFANTWQSNILNRHFGRVMHSNALGRVASAQKCTVVLPIYAVYVA